MPFGPHHFTLAIQSGLYEGVVETVSEGRYAIGSDLASDIVLVEDGIASHHVIVGLAGSSARIEAVAPGVAIDGAALAVGEAAEVQLPASLAIGATRVALARNQAPAGDRPDSVAARSMPLPPRTMVRALLGLQVVAVLVLMVVPNPMADAWSRAETGQEVRLAHAVPPAFPDGAPSPVTDARTGPTTTGSTAAGALSVPPVGSPSERRPASAIVAPGRAPDAQPSAEGAAEALRAEVERLGLLNVIVDAGAGIVTAGGTVEPGTAARWQSVQQWFDEQFAGEVTLVNGVSVKAEKLPVALGIEAVWRGEPSHLIIRGQKYLEGAVLDGGWVIQRIESERVVLERDGRMVAVRY